MITRKVVVAILDSILERRDFIQGNVAMIEQWEINSKLFIYREFNSSMLCIGFMDPKEGPMLSSYYPSTFNRRFPKFLGVAHYEVNHGKKSQWSAEQFEQWVGDVLHIAAIS